MKKTGINETFFALFTVLFFACLAAMLGQQAGGPSGMTGWLGLSTIVAFSAAVGYGYAALRRRRKSTGKTSRH